MRGVASGPPRVTAAVMAALVVALHAPVFTRGALITPAGMHYAQWPWKAYAAQAAAGGARPEENPALSDLLFQVYPWQLHIARSLAAGSVPLWNPYSYCGAPFVANAQSAVFYPLHWPAWLFPSMRVFTMALLLKILLAGIFMAIFLQGLGLGTAPAAAGSVSFALCGFMTSWLGYAHTNAAVALPLLMHAARLLAARPGAAPFLLLSFAGAAQYLGGHPETSLHIVGAVSLYFLWCLRGSPRPRAAAGMFAAAGLIGFAMSAVQMLPFLEYLAGSAALRQRQALAGMDPSLPPEALLTLLVPGYYGRPWQFSYDGPAPWQAVVGYAGAGVLLLALLSLRWSRGARFFQILAAVSAVIVYGPPAARAALRVIPVAGIASNNRLLLLLAFCLATLAAHTLHEISAALASARGAGRMRLAALPVLAAMPLIALAAWASGRDPDGGRLAAGVVAGTALLPAVAALRRSSRGGVCVAGVAAVTCLDLFLFALKFNPHADPSTLFPPTIVTDFLRQDAAADMVRAGRLMTVGWAMRPETQMVYRLSSIEGYDAMELDRYRRLLDRAQVASIHQTGEVPAASRPLLDLIGLRYIVTPPGGVVSGEAMRLGYDGPDGRVFVNERAGPRFRFVEGAAAAPADDAAALEDLASGRHDPSRVVLLEEGGPVAPPAGAAAPSIALERGAPGRLEIAVKGHGGPGWLVIADAWHAGWRAQVNGRDAEVQRADYCFMAVRLPAGDAAVSLLYRPASFRAGAWISALTLLVVLAVGLVHWSGAWRQPR